ncbi:MAG: inositol phosphate phosphatase SopB [Candidatus Methylacidiphilales bacterium]
MSLLTQIHSLASAGTDLSHVLVSPDGREIGHAPSGFQGRNVSARPGEKCVKDARNIMEGALRQRYGDHIADAIRSNPRVWGSTSQPLSLRRAIALDNRAAKMQRDITSGNLRAGRALVSSGLEDAVRDFQEENELPANLTREEKSAIVKQAAQKMMASPLMHSRPIKAADAREFLIKAIEAHYTAKARGFMEGMRHLGQLPELHLGTVTLEEMRAEMHRLGPEEAEPARDAIDILAEGNILLGDCPIASTDVQDLSQKAQKLGTRIDNKLHEIGLLKEGGDVSDTLLALEQELVDMKDKLAGHVKYHQAFLSKDPVAKQNLEVSVWMHSRAAMLAIDDLIREFPEDAVALRALRGQIEQRYDNRRVAAKQPPQDVDNVKGYLKAGKNEIEDILWSGLDDLDFDVDPKALIHEKAAEAQNRFAGFDPVKSTYQFRLGARAYNIQSDITPARHIGGLKESYEAHGLRGVSSGSSKETRHCVNLAHTKATAEDGTVLFQGMRHGILSAFGVPRGIIASIRGFFGTRERANTARAMEVVKASAAMDPALVRQAMARGLDGEPVSLNISSIGLVTPDNTRRFLNFISGGLLFKNSNEHQQMKEQFAAWKSVDGVHEIEVPNPDNLGEMVRIKVKVDTMAFNFGVNQGAVKGAGPFSSSWRHTGGWQNVKDENRAAMEKLFGSDLSSSSSPLGGKVDEYLKRTDVTPEQKEIVRELASQIREMWNDDSYQQQGGEPYKMVARLSVLCDKMGLKVAFNCKSGKDRTGMLDAQAKNLAAYIHYHGKVPELGQELTPQDRVNERDAILRGGGLKMHEYNVGIGGYKLGDVDDNYVRIGAARGKKKHVIDQPAMRAMEGGAKFVSE